MLGAILWMGAPRAAQARAETPESQVERLAAEAVNANRGADYNRAVELLNKAYEIRQVPALLYNLAKAYDKLGDVDHAADAYRRFADSADADPRLKAKAEARLVILDEARRKKAAAAARPPEPPPPPHATPRASEPARAPLVTAPPPPPGPPPPTAAELRAQAQAERLRVRHRDRLVALGVGAGAAACFAVAIGLSVDALSLQHEYGQTVDFTRKTQLKSDALARANAADALYAAGGLATAVMAVFLYRGFRPEHELALAPAVGPSGAALVAAGRF
jgi:tetratricopeptide (TPR) repeat protein